MKRIGIALTDEYTDISLQKEEFTYRFPTLLGRERREKRFYIGEEAYKKNLDGGVILVDRLLSLFKKKGTATLAEECYSSEELLGIFLENLLMEGMKRVEGREISDSEGRDTDEGIGKESGKDTLVLTVRDAEPEFMHSLYMLLKERFSSRYEIKLISHAESFAHYILRQDKKFYHRLVGMLEFSSQVLYYYEMQVSKGSRNYAVSAGEAQPDALSSGILEDPRGRKMTDQVLSSLTDRITKGKVYSAFFLAGKGFENTEIFPEFMKKILRGRRVCVESFLFAIGAMEYGKLLSRGEEEEYLLLCDTRLKHDLSIRVMQKEREYPFYLAKAGDSWLKEEKDIHLLIDKEDYIDFFVKDLSGAKGKQYRMSLKTFPKRDRKCTKLALGVQFSGNTQAKLKLTDLGFGDFWKGTFTSIEESIPLGKE